MPTSPLYTLFWSSSSWMSPSVFELFFFSTLCVSNKVEPIVGLRFSCIHCPEFNVCSKCEKTHFKHPTDHVFRIYTG